MFECKNLCFSYYRSPLCLKDVNFFVAKNSKNLILASKEMGKTTILKVLSGFEDSRFGNIYFEKKELKEIKDEDKRFSLVLSDIVLFENKTVKENIDYQCVVNNLECLTTEQAKELFLEFGLEIDLNIKVKKLSLVEKRKLQIVRAFIKKPKILFLDDQFENLNENDLNEMLKVYKKIILKFDSIMFFAIGDETFKRFASDLENFNFDNVFYLNLAKVKKFNDLKSFKESYASLDCLKFLSDSITENGYIEKDQSGYWFCKNEVKVFKFNSKFNKKLDLLLLNFAETEDCVLCFKNKVENLKHDDNINDLLENKDAFIFSMLTGNRVV